MSTISNQTIIQTVTLGSVNSYPTYASQLTITANGTIVASSGNGVYGGITEFGTINNAGRITAGISVIEIHDGAGTVTKLGAVFGIVGSGIYLASGGVVTNSGVIHSGAAAALDDPAKTRHQ
ncbi:MAG: hypothetical protein WA459_24170 [Stellaceae bacterium]